MFLEESFPGLIFFFHFYLFILKEGEREREGERAYKWGGAEREGERIPSRLDTVRADPDAGLDLTKT